MGCWNETCGLSNLPIRSGDEVVLYILKPTYGNMNFTPRAYCVNDNYAPLYTAIKGQYNDYGGIEYPVFDPELVPYLNSLGIQYINDKKETTTHTFPAMDHKDFEDEFNKFIHEFTDKRYWLPDFRGDKCFLNAMFVHADIHDHMVEYMLARKPYNREETLGMLIGNKLDTLVKREFNKYEAIRSRLNDDSPAYLYGNPLDDIFKGMVAKEVGRLLSRYYDSSYLDFKERFTELAGFTYVLSYMRKGWLCQTGLGSQGIELALHRELASFIISIIDEEKHSYGGVPLQDSIYWWDDNE